MSNRKVIVVLGFKIATPSTEGMEGLPVLPQLIPLRAVGLLVATFDEEVEVGCQFEGMGAIEAVTNDASKLQV